MILHVMSTLNGQFCVLVLCNVVSRIFDFVMTFANDFVMTFANVLLDQSGCEKDTQEMV
jgi:hypothetical protein